MIRSAIACALWLRTMPEAEIAEPGRGQWKDNPEIPFSSEPLRNCSRPPVFVESRRSRRPARASGTNPPLCAKVETAVISLRCDAYGSARRTSIAAPREARARPPPQHAAAPLRHIVRGASTPRMKKAGPLRQQRTGRVPKQSTPLPRSGFHARKRTYGFYAQSQD